MGVKRELQPPKCRRGRGASSTGVSRFTLRKHVALNYQPKRIWSLFNAVNVAYVRWQPEMTVKKLSSLFVV